jgi:shikimate kinase
MGNEKEISELHGMGKTTILKKFAKDLNVPVFNFDLILNYL